MSPRPEPGSLPPKKALAHYKGVLRAAERMNAMGHQTASGGKPPKPPKKGCGLFVIAVGLGVVLLAGTAMRVVGLI